MLQFRISLFGLLLALMAGIAQPAHADAQSLGPFRHAADDAGGAQVAAAVQAAAGGIKYF